MSKITLSLFCFCTILSISAIAADSLLSKEQEKKIISILNSVCDDAICAGDQNFRNFSVNCLASSKSCLVKADMINYYQEKTDDEYFQFLKTKRPKIQGKFSSGTFKIVDFFLADDPREEEKTNDVFLGFKLQCEIKGFQTTNDIINESVRGIERIRKLYSGLSVCTKKTQAAVDRQYQDWLSNN